MRITVNSEKRLVTESMLFLGTHLTYSRLLWAHFGDEKLIYRSSYQVLYRNESGDRCGSLSDANKGLISTDVDGLAFTVRKVGPGPLREIVVNGRQLWVQTAEDETLSYERIVEHAFLDEGVKTPTVVFRNNRYGNEGVVSPGDDVHIRHSGYKPGPAPMGEMTIFAVADTSGA